MPSLTERLLGALEREAQNYLPRLLQRLAPPSRREIHRLARRISQLERRLRTAQPTRGAPVHEPQRRQHARAGEQHMNSLQFATLFWDEV